VTNDGWNEVYKSFESISGQFIRISVYTEKLYESECSD